MLQKTKIFAHRGSSGTHPENTMGAFQAALATQSDGIECDVQLSKDGVPVIIHDETLERTTNGKGWVKDYTYEELKQLDAGSWFNPDLSKEGIPSLEQLLQWLKETSLDLNIEFKNGVVRYPNLEAIVLELVSKYQLNDRVIISSFNHYSLVEIKKIEPEIETAILFMEGLYEPWHYAKTIGANGLHCFFPVAVPELLRGAKKAQMPVRPFTVNEESHMQSLFTNGCSAIITDWPKKAVSLRDAK